MAVALLALVVALGGTAIAASTAVNGDSLIKKHTLSANRLRNHTLTGNQIDLSKLGKVPAAKQADTATSAASATNALNANNAANATNATNATNAANAAALGGLSPSSFVVTSRANDKVTVVSGTPTGNKVTLFTQGPFTVTMTCTKTAGPGNLVSATVDVTSTEAATTVYGDTPTAATGTPAGTPQTAISSAPPTTSFAQNTDNMVDVEAPSGAVMWFAAAVYLNNPVSSTVTNDCEVNILRLV